MTADHSEQIAALRLVLAELRTRGEVTLANRMQDALDALVAALAAAAGGTDGGKEGAEG